MSRARGWLAVYVDYLFFAAIWAPLSWSLRDTVAVGGPAIALAVFAALRLAIVRFVGATPGYAALGISWTSTGLSVDAALARRETWWTIAAGVLLVLEGSKNLVRWTEGLTPPPLFGVGLEPGPSFLAISLVGALNVAAGLLVLRMRPIGALIAILGSAAELASFALGGEALASWIVRRTLERRELQGLPVREGEIEFMQAVLPAGVIGAALVGIVWLVCVYRRASAVR